MTENKKQCSVRVHERGDWIGRGYPCPKPAKVERDGKWFCTIKDPEYIKAKRAKERAEADKEGAERHERDALAFAGRKAVRGLTLQELWRVTPELIRKALEEEGK